MAKDHLSGKLAVILHADMVGSTRLVQQDEQLAHVRIQDAFRRFSDTIGKYHGRVQELRGDALLAEFERASDAVTAALAFLSDHGEHLAGINDDIRPDIRVGIALGEVVIADRTVTGAGVVLAQRIEQLAQPGGLCVTSAIHEALPNRLPFIFESLGEQELKGFEESVRVYRVQLDGDAIVPPPQMKTRQSAPPNRMLRTLIGAALLVVAAIGIWQKLSPPREEPASIERMAFPLPDKPSIAVLPFNNMSDDPKQEYFADGMTEDLITDLSKISGLFVIARNSSFSYKGQQVKVRQVAEDLGVRYVLEGSVRRAGDQVRINAQLIDATTGGHIWAERYDGSLPDVFRLQDKVSRNIVNALAVTLTAEEKDNAALTGTSDIEAHNAYLQGLSFYSMNSPIDNARAEPLLKRAIELDPDFGRAYAALARVYFRGTEWAFASALGITPRRAAFFAYQTLAKGPAMSDQEIHANQARAALIKHQLKSALQEADLALAINPDDIDILKTKALALIFSGQHGAGRLLVDRMVRLDPASLAEPLYIYGLIEFSNRQYHQASKFIEKALNYDPSNGVYNRLLAAVYGILGRIEEGQEALQIYRKSRRIPYWISAAVYEYPFEAEDNLQALADGFEAVGLVERPPARYLLLNSETRLTGAEIEALLTGRTIRGTSFWRGDHWLLHRSRDGMLKQLEDTAWFFYSIDLREVERESWIDGNRLCHPGTGVNEEITFCASVHRDINRGEGHYYMMTDTGPHPFTVED